VTARRKWTWRLAALAGLLPVAAGGLIAWLACTEAGLARVVAVLESLESLQLHVEGARGTLAGPLHLDSLDLKAGRVQLHAASIDLEHDLSALAFGRLAVARLQIGTVAIAIGPATRPPSDQPPRFMPRWLSLGIDAVQVGSLDLELPDGTRQHYSDVTASGRATHARIDLDEAAADAGPWTARGGLRLVARQPLALSGELDWTVRGRPDLHGTLRARGDLARLFASVELLEPAAASADVTLTDLAAGLRWEARVDAAAFDLSAWLDEPPLGPLSGFLEGSGTLTAISARGHVTGAGLAAGGLDLEAGLQRDGAALTIDSLRLSTPDGRQSVVTAGVLQLGEQRSLRLSSQWSALAWPLAGTPAVTSPQGRLEVEGWNALAFTTDAIVALPNLPETRIVASGRADRAGITVRQATLSGPAGRAQASAYLGFTPGIPWQFDAQFADLDLGRFRAGLDSRLAFAAAGSGVGTGEQRAWAAHIGPVGGKLRGYPLSGTGFIVQSQGRYDFRQFAFRLGPAQVELSGHVDGHTALVAHIASPDLAGLFDGAGGSVEATVSLESSGPPLPDRSNLRLDVALRGRDLRWGEQHAAVLSADAVVDLSDRETSWARLRAAGLTVAGQTLDTARVSLDGLLRRHDFDLRIGAGESAVSLLGSGRYEDASYQLTASRIESDAPALRPYSLEGPMVLSVAAGAVRLAETCLVHPPRRICLDGRWERGSGWLVATSVADFPLEALSVDLPRQPGYRGLLDFDLRASGAPGRPWTATASGSLRDARLLYKTPSGRLEELDLGVTRIHVDSLPDRHRLSLVTEDTDALQLRGEATLERDERTALRDSRLQGSLQLATTRLGLLPLLVPEIDRAAGALRADLQLSGSPASPAAGGTLVLSDAELDLYATNLRLRELGARVEFSDSGLTIESSGKAGDGSFRTGGKLGWQDRILRGTLTLTGDRLLVTDVPEARIEASPDLSFAIDGRQVAVTGSVTIPTARIEPRQIVGAVGSSADERIVSGEAEETPKDGYRLRADVRLNLGKGVRLDAFGLSGRLEGSVLTQTRPDEVTTGSGELAVEDGKYRAYGKELDVERGRLLFAGGPVTDPGIDLRAKRDLPGYEIGVIVRGRLRRPELSLYSDPSMPQSQIASLLLVGRRLDNLDPGDRSALGGSTANIATQGGALLAGQLGRYVGLDEVSVETDADYQASLVIGKFLSPRLYVSYGISLTEAINTFKLRYTIGDRWVIAGEAGAQGSVDIEYTIDR
jgi:translocation and assembly module TamB